MGETIRKRHGRLDLTQREPGPGDLAPEDLQRRLGDANAAYVAAHARTAIPSTPRLGLAVVACMDCRLTGRLEDALGLRPDDAVVIRVAGNTAAGTDDLTRSLVIAVVEQKVRTILVVGHTDCALASIEPLAFRERLSERRVSRLALGTQPLREWLGLFPDVAQNVRDTVAKLRQTPALPRDVRVLGALMEVQTGELTWLDD